MRLSSTGKTYNNPVTLNGNGTFLESATTTTTFTGATNTFGALTVLSTATLTSTNRNGAANGVTTGNVGLVFPSASLSGDLTVNVVNPTATGSIGTVSIGTAGGAGISETAAGKSLIKSGPGALSILGSATYTGTTTIQAGTLNLVGAAAWTSSALNNSAGGVVINGGRLNFDYTSNVGDDPVATIKTILNQTAFNNNFASGQIRTTNAPDGKHAIGWIDDTANKKLRVGYTYSGDADVNGVVNTGDFTALAAHFNNTALATPGSPVWAEGDFNYDGFVNALDFNSLATNIGAAAILAPPLGASGLGSLVPEPGSLSLLALGAATLATRRRRK
jgi:autotransporter-associated beta strand protein